jgi:hypothetical protein
MLFGSQHAVAYFAAKAGGVDDRMMLRQLSEAFMQHDDVIHQVIDHVRGEQINRLKQQRRQVLEQVLVRNVGSSGSSMSGSSMIELGLEADFTLDELPGSISRFSSNDSHWQSTLRRVTDRYGFLSDRNYTKNNLWAVNLRCPLKRHELRRRGSTSIDPVGAWSARDDQSFHALRFNRVIGCYQREYPMGWALVDGTSRTETSEPIQKKFEIVTQNFSNESFWRWVGKQSDDRWNIFAGVDNRLARRWASMGEIRWTTKGAPTYAALTPKNKKSIGIAVAVKQRGSMIHAKGPMRNNAMGGRFALNTNERIQALQTESAAETYFSPPTAVSFHSPLPNLLQPFWKARLIDIADLKGQKSTDQPIAHRGETR